MSETLTAESAGIQSLTVAFLNFCRVEKGLSANSIEAYNADLSSFSRFSGDGPLAGTEAIRHYIDHLYERKLGNRSIARHLTTLRNFYGFLLREGIVDRDPTEFLKAPRQWQTIPKYLNAKDIDSLLDAPDASTPKGLRDRAMLQLLYAAGLRVSELCRTGIGDLNLEMGVLRTMGKGNKQRLIPVGREAIQAVEAYLGSGTPGAAQGTREPVSVCDRARRVPHPPRILEAAGRTWPVGRYFSRADAACAASQLRYPFAGAWSRFAKRANYAGTLRYFDDADLYACNAVEIAGYDPGASPPGLKFEKVGPRAATMSDYIYILENHLSADQSKVVREVQDASGQAGLTLFLTGGAMRDMLAGFRIRDLDFVVEGPALKLAKAVSDKTNAKIISSDENRKSAELLFARRRDGADLDVETREVCPFRQ